MRPQIEYLHQNRLDWRDGFLAGTTERTLSRDEESAADSSVVNYPAGWDQGDARVLGAAEEIFVLAGTLAVNGVDHGPLSYARWPEGTQIDQSSSGEGAVAVLFRSQDPSIIVADGPDNRKLVEKIDCLTVGPSPMRTPDFPNPEGVTRINLFDDPDTGESTWILAGPALRAGSKPEVHPVVEEMFLVAGKMHSPLGTMNPGAYFWRPENVWHGPFSNLSGCVCLFRTQGGPLSTVYTDAIEGSPWNHEYAPFLPDDLDLVRDEPTELDTWRSATIIQG